MKKAALILLVTHLLCVSDGGAAGINLSWFDCGTNGTSTLSFACNSNAGAPFMLVGSFDPPANINEFIGIAAQVDITTDQPLPDWWKHGAAQCRGTSGLSTSFDFSSGPFTCTDFFASVATGGFTYDVGFASPNRARLGIHCEVPTENRGPLAAGTEYYAFKVNLMRPKSTGPGNCTGCFGPACIVFSDIQLFQAPAAGFDPDITSPRDRNYVFWQSTPLGVCPPITQIGPPASKGECMDGGWMRFNTPRVFKNQGDCIKFVNTGK